MRKGNLTYDVNATTNKWKFYEHQYDCATGYDANLISLFTWGYSASTSLKPNGTGYSTKGDKLVYDKASSEGGDDWGVAYCESNNITVGTWRTLDSGEWDYLFNSRAASTRYAKATVNYIKGVILLPDTYTHPGGVAALKSINTVNVAFTANIYDLDAWEKMESAGAVFLPAAGYREGSTLNKIGEYCNYWSSTPYASTPYAYFAHIRDTQVMVDYDYRSFGRSVRLVLESQWYSEEE